MCLLTTYSTLKCELCICTNRRLLPGSTKIRTKINPCLSKRNPWGTTRSHCWTTTLPWPTTSARNGPSHQSLWPNILGKCFVTRLFGKWTFEFNQQFLYPFFGGRKSSNFFGQRPWKNISLMDGKQQLPDPDCRASFSPSLICISCWTGRYLRIYQLHAKTLTEESNMFTKIHKTYLFLRG